MKFLAKLKGLKLPFLKKKTEAATPAAVAPSPKKDFSDPRSKKLLIGTFFFGVAFAVMTSILVARLWPHKFASHSSPEEKAEHEGAPPAVPEKAPEERHIVVREMVKFDSISASLLGGSYIRVSLVAECDAFECSQFLDSHRSMVNDIVIEIAAKYSRDRLQLSAGKKVFREEVLKKLAEEKIPGKLMNIYFTDFLLTEPK